jgi:hypothetical protein
MRKPWWLLLCLVPILAHAQQDVVVPEGFVLQTLEPTDGQIAKPKDWYYTSEGTPSGWMWTLSKEDTAKGAYETGMRIQMMFDVQADSGLTKAAFIDKFVRDKVASSEVIRNCPVTDEGEFFRRCLEVLEDIPLKGVAERFHILYSLSWSKNMDMVVVSIFGTPLADWPAQAATADAMAHFRLIGPGLGKDAKGGGDTKVAAIAPAKFDTVYNHVSPESVQRGQDEALKALYASQYKFIDIETSERFVAGKAVAGYLPSAAFAQDGTPLTGEATIAYIVTPDGHAAEPRFVKITDERLRDTVLAAIGTWRLEPGRLDGKPVATLAAQNFSFKPTAQ